MAYNQKLLEALEALTFDFDNRYALTQALADLTEVDLSLEIGATTFRRTVLEHRIILQLPEEMAQMNCISSQHLHHNGEGENARCNNFRALQRFAAQRRVEFSLELIDLDSLRLMTNVSDIEELRTLLEQIPCFKNLSKAYRWRGGPEDPPILTNDALDKILEMAHSFYDDKTALYTRLRRKLAVDSNKANFELIKRLLEQTQKLFNEQLYFEDVINVLDKTYRFLDGTFPKEEYTLLANEIEGKPNPLLKGIGITMIAISSLVGIIGLSMVATSTVTAAAAIGAGALVLGLGYGFFHEGKRQGLSRTIRQIIRADENKELGPQLYAPSLGNQ
ncbi:Uncharacterised protein [Legionella adelaidensis]|uniref:VipE n=2 Tax=Legionella adelaidensis TaxID=45056 RepID=A0A0W0R6F2_9GAMM|nr:hypothetical protein Lade_1275 [Legionella adelaidensis]VEH81065.1 Uncharacterised protein [Legionella adelaidensis]